MNVLFASVESFFFVLIGTSLAAAVVYFASRLKPDVPLILAISIGIGIARGLEIQWVALAAHNLVIVGICVGLCAGISRFWRGRVT